MPNLHGQMNTLILPHTETKAANIGIPAVWKEFYTPLVLQTDKSSLSLGFILEQKGHVIAYASITLSKAKQQYSVIQKECLVAVFAVKQFKHYLFGGKFQLLTHHNPLQ